LFLHRAYSALRAGQVGEAGVQLREAVRRQLYAECCWKSCLPDDYTERMPARTLLESLKRAGCCGHVGYSWTKDIIAIANKCCHAKYVRPGEIRMAIAIWHESIDHDPCGEEPFRVAHCTPPNCPLINGQWDDDDDDWKAGIGGAV
jgi:hypothetical protein